MQRNCPGPLGHQPRGAPQSGQPQPDDSGVNILPEISAKKSFRSWRFKLIMDFKIDRSMRIDFWLLVFGNPHQEYQFHPFLYLGSIEESSRRVTSLNNLEKY